VARAAAATAAMTTGFLVVFAVFGVLTVSVAATVQSYLPIVTVLVGATLVVIGGWLSIGRQLHLPLQPALTDRAGASPTARVWSMFGYGVAYAVASLSCTVGPFLAITAAGVRGGSIAGSVAVYAAYAAGFALIVGTLAVAAAFASSAVADRIRRVLPIVNRAGGALVAVVGLYVLYYGIYELRLFHTNASPEDAVIAAAGRLQGTIAGWVHGHGGWPWLVVLALLLAATAAIAWRRNVRSR
jgi:cytochrome c biogenesis protein CcdA